MPVKGTNNVGICRDEDKTKEQLIDELKWYREHTEYLARECSRAENDNHKLTEQLTNVKRALAANCEALKDAIGWHGYGVSDERR